MKLYFEDDNGNKMEVKRATGLQEGDVILFTHMLMRERDLEKMEYELSRRMNRKVIILDGHFQDIVILPPVKELGGRTFEDRQPRLT